MKEQIEQTLSALIGLPLWGSHRAANLQGFMFGERIPTMTRATKRWPAEAVMIGEYGLHLQCPWRIVEAARIVVASSDLSYAAGDDPYKDYEDFDYDKQPNRRDERITALIEAWTENPPTVESVKADMVGSFSLGLSRQYMLNVFPADSLDGEHWRLLPNAPMRKHFVVTGKGIEG